MMPGHNFIKYPFRHHWKNNNHQCGDNGAGQHREHENRVTFQVSKDAPDRYPVLALAMLARSEEHTSELQSRREFVCRLLLEKNKTFAFRQGHPRTLCDAPD